MPWWPSDTLRQLVNVGFLCSRIDLLIWQFVGTNVFELDSSDWIVSFELLSSLLGASVPVNLAVVSIASWTFWMFSMWGVGIHLFPAPL